MKTRRTKLMLSASAVALSLALAGCGGGGGGPQSNLALNSGGSPQNSGGSTSANNDPVNTGGSPQNSGGSTSAGNNPVNTGGSPQNSGGSTSAGNNPVNTGGSPQSSGGSTSANNDPVNTGGSPQNSGGSTSANNDPVNTGGSPQSSGGSTSANNDPVNTGGSPQSNTDDNDPVNTASNNNDNIGVSPGGDGPSRAQENTSPTAAERAKAAAEAAEEKIDQAAQGPLTDFFQGRTLSKAMGVSANIGAGDAVRAVSTIEREIAAVRRHLTTATNSATNLRTRADRLREAEAEHEMRLEAADDPKAAGNIHDLQKMLAEAEDAARHVESVIAAVDYYVNEKEEDAQEADAFAARLEAGGPECGSHCPGPGNPPNLDGAKASRQEAANLRKDAREYKALPITYDETEYTYARLKSIATSKRRAADAEKRKVDAKQAEIDRLSERLIQAEEDTKMAEEAAATAEDQAGEIEAILKPLEDSLEEWQGVIAASASALESAKAKQVLDLLALNVLIRPVGVFLPSDAIADLDTKDHVFARASNKPARTMTFEDIANGNEAWVYHRRSFLKSDDNTMIDTDAHGPVVWQTTGQGQNQVTINMGGTGLPRNHPAIALSGLDTTVFVRQDGTSPAHAQAEQRRYFHHGKLNGIDGTLYCDRVQGCSTYTKSSRTEFLDGWYFTPAVHESRQESLGYNPAEARFEDSDNDGTYDPVSYVDYGMWLEGADDALQLHRRANLVGPNVGPRLLDFFVGINGNNDLNATYNGKARGLSARTRGSRTASGHFTADVELVATFLNPQPYEPATLAGTINNFRAVAGQGSGHVDTGWSIRLQAPLVAATGEASGYATAGSLSNPTGGWNATAYGANRNERPDGFYGGFNTKFCDGECKNDFTNVVGAAVGVYSAEKQ